MTKDNNLLGKFELSGIHPAPRGEPKIDVAFDLDSVPLHGIKIKNEIYLTVDLHMGVISDPTVDNATILQVLNNIVPNGSMTL